MPPSAPAVIKPASSFFGLRTQREIFLSLAATLIAIHVVYALIILDLFGINAAGNFGDMFGALASVVNSLSLLLIVATFSVQHRQLVHSERTAAADLELRRGQ